MTAISDRRPRWLAVAAAVALALVALLATAHRSVAAGEEDPFTDVKPAGGSVIVHGHAPTFSARIVDPPTDPMETMAVFVRVSTSKKVDGKGLIGDDVYIDQLNFDHGSHDHPRYSRAARPYSYDTYWLNQRGKTYYWQVYYIYCSAKASEKDPTCFHPGKPRKLRVK
jgi:hypothetical protein